jgi:hypothetical protein
MASSGSKGFVRKRGRKLHVALRSSVSQRQRQEVERKRQAEGVNNEALGTMELTSTIHC